MKYKKGIFIFRRDFRIQDNTALHEANKMCKDIMPIFIFTPEQINKNEYKSDNAVLFMIECLEGLEKEIKEMNGRIYFFYNNYLDTIKEITERYEDIEAVFVNCDYSLYSKKRDKEIKDYCESKNICFHSYHDECLYPPQTIRTTTNTIYNKFTPFYNNVLERKVDKPKKITNISFDKITRRGMNKRITLQEAKRKFTKENKYLEVRGGRKHALHILKNSKKLKKYEENRDCFNYETSKLSGYIKFGVVSIREVYDTWKRKFGLQSGIVRQLIWRDFYFHLLDDNPQLMKNKSFRENYDKIEWENNESFFEAWKSGNTGYPIVDACMRHMNTTGYMPNRGRLIVSSMLIKTLLIDWKKGEKYFAQTLLDYDPAANNGNWQWMSGSGADSQPYFRIFNPFSQGERFDKDATYIKKWVPELKDIDPKDIHNWETKYLEYKNIKYPKPIVNFSERRKIANKMYKKIF